MMLSVRHYSEVFSTLAGFRETGFLCDTVLITRDKPLKAHSVLLSAVSPFFQSAIRSLNEHKQKIFPFEAAPGKQATYYIAVQMVEMETVEIALKFMYTGKLMLPQQCSQNPTEMQMLFKELDQLGLNAFKLEGCSVMFESASSVEASNQLTTGDIAEAKSDHDSSMCNIKEEETRDDVSEDIDSSSTIDWCENNPSPIAVHKLCGQAIFKESNSGSASRNAVKIPLSNGANNVQAMALLHRQRAAVCYPASVRSSTLMSMQKEKSQLNANSASKGDDLIQQSVEFQYKEKANSPRKTGSTECSSLAKKHRFLFQNMGETDEEGFSKNKPGEYKQRKILRRKSKVSVDRPLTDADRPYACTTCGKAYTTPGSLDFHERAAHLGLLPPHVCTYCGKRLWRESALALHEQSHTGIRPHLCELCGKGFSSEKILESHVIVRHLVKSGVAVEKFPCSQCSRVFNLPGNLRGHVRRVHEPGANERKEAAAQRKARLCSVCGVCFASVPSRIIHEKRHCRDEAAT